MTRPGNWWKSIGRKQAVRIEFERTISLIAGTAPQCLKRMKGVIIWRVTEPDLEAIAIGAGILGTGGGGNPYVGKLRARQAIREYGSVDILSPNELPEDARIVCVGIIGAPTVGNEKIPDYQSYYALRALEAFVDQPATALLPNEIGGTNSVESFVPASIARIPVVDADGMGRAFPEFQMKTFLHIRCSVHTNGACR
jgi:DUF917 family protein